MKAVPTHLRAPVRMKAAGNKPKQIEEFVGRLATGHDQVSVACMRSPQGWTEPAQEPQFDEFTLVLAGTLRVTSAEGDVDVTTGHCRHRPRRGAGAVLDSEPRGRPLRGGVHAGVLS
jgi:mannose-6-phosphate isomerase-like protein (cupin superfamily)